MAIRVNPKWLKLHTDAFKQANIDGTVYSVLTDYATGSSKLALALARLDIAFKVDNLGAGVKRISNATDICPKCKGTGKC